MTALAEKFTQTGPIGGSVSRSKPERVVDLAHPLVARILSLRAMGKNIMNGPNAYRSVEFVKWHKGTIGLYAEIKQMGLPQVFEDRLNQRTFGRTLSVATELQIFTTFKTDMSATIQDFQRILIVFEKNRQIDKEEISGSYVELLNVKNIFSTTWVSCAGLLLLVFAVLAIGTLIIK